MSKPKAATVAELIAVIREYKELQALALAHAAAMKGQPNPLLDELYLAATAAAKALQPLVGVEIKTVLTIPTPPA